MNDDLTIPAFLDRKTNGVVSGVNTEHNGRYVPKNGITWPRKKNWRKIAERRRKAEKADGVQLTAIHNRRGL